jgi:glycosyltransferase involved in cell wall biosynthesis
MKVVLAVHCFFPEHVYGTETYTLRLAQHLQAIGHEVTVLSAVFAGEPKRAELVTRYVFEGVPVVSIDRNHLPPQSLREYYDLPALEPILDGILAAEQPDVLHITQLMNHTVALVRVANRRGIALFATLTDFHAFCFNGRLEDAQGKPCLGPDAIAANCLACLVREAANHSWTDPKLRRTVPPASALPSLCVGLARRVLQPHSPEAVAMKELQRRREHVLASYAGCRAVITPTSFLERAFRRQAPDWNYQRMNFGVDVDRSEKPKRPESQKQLVVGFIGQLTAHKGLDLLIEAMRSLPAGSAVLQVFGSEQQDPGYAASQRFAAAEMQVEFRGTFPSGEIASILADLDVLVIPSRWYENCPLVLLNALATHTPVIVTDVEGMTEFISPGRNGYTFPLGQSAALAVELRRFVQDPGLAEKLSAQTEYLRTTRLMAEEVSNLYSSTHNSAEP